MERFYDEVAKSIAGSVSRRESLKRMGAAFAGAALGQFGLGSAWGAAVNPCKAFCNRCPTKAQKNQCLQTCKACNNKTNRMCGGCGHYVCCGAGEACCTDYCTDLAYDFDNCGGCGAACDYPGPFEQGVCFEGACVYACVDGAADCGDGTCTWLGNDPNNCGACGNVCGNSTPYCIDGECSGMTPCPGGQTLCSGVCHDLDNDSSNCGACGNVCGGATPFCIDGACSGNPCAFPFIPCNGVCVDPTSDPFNCGGCGNQCGPLEACIGGFCESG